MGNIIIPLAVIAGLLVVIIGAGFFIKVKLSGLSREFFGTDDFMEGYKEQKRKLAESPRSVQGMTSIYLPEILRDAGHDGQHDHLPCQRLSFAEIRRADSEEDHAEKRENGCALQRVDFARTGDFIADAAEASEEAAEYCDEK